MPSKNQTTKPKQKQDDWHYAAPLELFKSYAAIAINISLLRSYLLYSSLVLWNGNQRKYHIRFSEM